MNTQAIRTGWNARGGTWRDDLEYARNFWETQAMLKIRDLREMLGDDYPVFAEMIFPGESINHMSWQSIDISLSNWIASGKAAIFDSLECTCQEKRKEAHYDYMYNGKPWSEVVSSNPCPVCKARARLRGEA